MRFHFRHERNMAKYSHRKLIGWFNWLILDMKCPIQRGTYNEKEKSPLCKFNILNFQISVEVITFQKYRSIYWYDVSTANPKQS